MYIFKFNKKKDSNILDFKIKNLVNFDQLARFVTSIS